VLVRDALRSWDLQHLEDVALLLVSELATNALLHARTGFAVEAVRRRGVLRVVVLDCSAAMPRPRRHDLAAGTGRGLSLIDTLAGSWGAETSADPWAKAVWFELPTTATAVR
jgi:anti-sigma regulatory factor (Ser/Thr protein kinase)